MGGEPFRTSDPFKTSMYDIDHLRWSEQQTAALRSLSRSRNDLPEDLDLEHLAEEIEDMGRSEIVAAQSFVRLMFVHIIKTASLPGAAAVPHWRREVLGFHNELLARLTLSMTQRLDLPILWRRAVREAAADLALYGQDVSSGLAHDCPLSVDRLIDPEFDFDACTGDLRQRLNT